MTTGYVISRFFSWICLSISILLSWANRFRSKRKGSSRRTTWKPPRPRPRRPAGDGHLVLDSDSEPDWELPPVAGTGKRNMRPEEWDEYWSLVAQSDGFGDVGDYISRSLDLGIIGHGRPSSNDPYLLPCAQAAVRQHNDTTSLQGGRELELVEIIKWNHQLTSAPVYYITLRAKDVDGGGGCVRSQGVDCTLGEQD